MDYFNIIFIVIILFLLYLVIKYKYKKAASTKAIKQRFERGRLLEYQASEFLVSEGYKIIEGQKQFKHEYYVDGIQKSSVLKIDYFVSKNGNKYIVEVKSGQSAISTSNSNTRRQLLEYSFAIPNDGVLLLDMENQKIKSIEFIQNKDLSQSYLIKAIIILAFIGIIIPLWTIKIIFIILLGLLFFQKPNYMYKISQKLYSITNNITSKW